MKFKPIFLLPLLFSVSTVTVYAAGGAVNEDMAPLLKLSEQMITACKKNDIESFQEPVSQALKITAENRNNSMVLPKISAKLRAAKSAFNKGNLDAAIEALQDAEQEMQKKRSLTWDGGS